MLNQRWRVQIFEELSGLLSKGNTLYKEYTEAHAKAAEGQWRIQESIRRAVEDEKVGSRGSQ